MSPIASQHEYSLSFLSLSDWQSIRIRYSEPCYLEQGSNEWTRLSFNYTDTRSRYQTFYADSSTELLALTPIDSFKPSDNFGTSLFNPIKKTWTVHLSTLGVNASATGYGPYSLRSYPLQCVTGQCDLTVDASLGEPKLWSSASTWPFNKVPAAGDNVTIPPGVYIVLDVSPAPIQTLTVHGKLQFDDSDDRLLVADNIVVWGSFEVGSRARPFSHKATITLTGVRTSPTVVISNLLFPGNKVLAVFGALELHGLIPSVTWTRLSSTLSVGDNTLELVDSVDWTAGQEITVSSTSYDANETETFKIDSVSENGKLVTISGVGAKFAHVGGVSVSDSFKLSAVVGLLTRNVIIDSALNGSSDTYGAHVFISEVASNGIQKTGKTQIRGVEFRNSGKQGMEYPGIWYKYLTAATNATSVVHVLEGCAFSNSFNYALVSSKSTGLVIKNNVFHRTYRSAVDVDADSKSLTIDNNAVIGNYHSPDDEQATFSRPFAGFFIDTEKLVSMHMRGNVVGGSQDSGFVWKLDTCTLWTARSHTISDNEAHSVLIGAFLLSNGTSCLALTNFKVWKAAHIGILTVDQTSNILLNQVSISDSHIGISLNFVRTNTDNNAIVQNSAIYGSTLASTCTESLTCLARTKNDPRGLSCGSVFGSK